MELYRLLQLNTSVGKTAPILPIHSAMIYTLESSHANTPLTVYEVKYLTATELPLMVTSVSTVLPLLMSIT